MYSTSVLPLVKGTLARWHVSTQCLDNQNNLTYVPVHLPVPVHILLNLPIIIQYYDRRTVCGHERQLMCLDGYIIGTMTIVSFTCHYTK